MRRISSCTLLSRPSILFAIRFRGGDQSRSVFLVNRYLLSIPCLLLLEEEDPVVKILNVSVGIRTHDAASRLYAAKLHLLVNIKLPGLFSPSQTSHDRVFLISHLIIRVHLFYELLLSSRCVQVLPTLRSTYFYARRLSKICEAQLVSNSR